MKVRKGTTEEMLSLWYKAYATEYMISLLNGDKAEFWTVEYNGALVGEVYLIKECGYEYLADGSSTAYIYALYIEEKRRRRGLGSILLKRVMDRCAELGFSYITIGVKESDTSNVSMYKRVGFSEKLCDMDINPFDVDENNRPQSTDEYMILRKNI